jgi:hypothetical protein
MTSTWRNKYVVGALEKGLQDRFKNIQEESHILIFLKVIHNTGTGIENDFKSHRYRNI